MSFRRFRIVGARDLATDLRRPLFWFWIALLLFFAWAFSSGKGLIQSGDSSVGGTKAYITSEFAVTQLLAILTTVISGFFVAIVSGMAVIQDDEHRLGDLLHSTPLTPGEYIGGKFSAIVVLSLIVTALQISAMMLFNHGLHSSGASLPFIGPFHLMNYLRPTLIFGIPTLVFMAGTSFAIGEWTRKPVLVFFLPVAVFLGCGFFLWDWSPSWLDPKVDRFLMFIDPAGYRWLTETHLKVDRGVRFYNTASVPLDGLIIANRLATLAVGILAVVWSRWHFASTLSGASKRAERSWKARVEAPEPDELFEASGQPNNDKPLSPARPLSSLGMTTRPPGLLAGAWTVAKAELVELRSSPGLYLFIPILVLEAVGPNILAVGPFDTPVLLTPGTFAVRSFSMLTTMACLLLLFYTVESLWRERQTRLAGISMATPVRTGSLLIGKAIANAVVGLVILVGEWLAAAIMIVYQGKLSPSLTPFILVWGLLLIPTLILWSAFVTAVSSICRNRYATYAICLAALMYTGYRNLSGKMNFVGNWGLFSALHWSDISILEYDRQALWLNRIFVLGLAAFFIALTTRFYFRRDLDSVGVASRFRAWPLLLSTLRLSPFAFVPVVVGTMLWVAVDRGFQGPSTVEKAKDYWRKNVATYTDWPLPDTTSVDVAVDLDPPRRSLKASGTFVLKNNQEKPIRQIPLTSGAHWKSPSWKLAGKPFQPENRSGLYVFNLPEPLEPGASTSISYAFEGEFPGGISENGGSTMEFILPSGVVLTSFGSAFGPVVGYVPQTGVDKDNSYESKEYLDDYYVGQTDSFTGSRLPFTTKVKITGPADFRLNSVGTIQSDEVANGRRTTVWESDQPVNFYNIVAGRWELKKGEGTAIYYSKKHPYNVDEMATALDAARTYYSEWFHPYPWRELKLSEFPAISSYAQGFPTDITFSESIGFLSKSEPKALSAFMVTAHESAHQWFGNMVAPGKGPGGNILSEGTSHFATMLLFEQVRGLRGRIDFARKIEDSYAKTRMADSERPLVKIDGTRDGDGTVTYDKAGFVFWMLLNHMGRERCLEGFQEYFTTYQSSPDHPVLQDFLGLMRTHAEDPDAFDAFTKQWFFKVVVPEYTLSDVIKKQDGNAWVVTATAKNIGKGHMPLEIAASKGERFPDAKEEKAKDKPKSEPVEYRQASTSVTLGAGDSEKVTIRCEFEPDQVVVDPDVKVLQLHRKEAVHKF